MHIQSNMRHLGRIGLFVRTIKKFLVNLKRHHRGLFYQLDKALVSRYLNKKEEAVFSIVKPSESSRTLNQLAQDIFSLVERFTSLDKVNEMNSFKLLVRLFKEQCLVADDEKSGEKLVAAKPNKEVASDSLQNPSDPDAGYSGHKGKGYQVQVTETYNPDSSEDKLSLITYVHVESADQNDANALLPALDNTKQREMAPDEVLADSLYGGDENCRKAKQDYGADVIAPVMGGGNKKGLSLDDFTVSKQGKILSCPQGHAPVTVKHKKKNYSAAFAITDCQNCPHQEECPTKKGKKAYYFRYKEKDVRLSRRRLFEETAEFKDKYRFRAGVEATMSEYDRRTGVKHLRVRGMKAVSFAAVLKATGINIFRAAAHKNRGNGTKEPSELGICHYLPFFTYVKEQIMLQSQQVVTLFSQIGLKTSFDHKMAA